MHYLIVLLAVAAIAFLAILLILMYRRRRSRAAPPIDRWNDGTPIHYTTYRLTPRARDFKGRHWQSIHNVTRRQNGENAARHEAAKVIQNYQGRRVERKLAPGGSMYMDLLSKYGNGPMKAQNSSN